MILYSESFNKIKDRILPDFPFLLEIVNVNIDDF